MSQEHEGVVRATDCPECNVLARRYGSYHAQDGTFRRYRRCPECGYEFITVEEKEEPVNQPEEEESSESEDFLSKWTEDEMDPRGG